MPKHQDTGGVRRSRSKTHALLTSALNSVVAQAVSSCPLTAETQVRIRVNQSMWRLWWTK
jgi:hypothetical protein